MKVLVDTNIVLDIILERQPFAEQASLLLQIVQKRNFFKQI